MDGKCLCCSSRLQIDNKFPPQIFAPTIIKPDLHPSIKLSITPGLEFFVSFGRVALVSEEIEMGQAGLVVVSA